VKGKVHLRGAARGDLDGIADYFAERSIPTALRFAAAAEAALSRPADSPLVGHPRPGEDPLLRQVRSWPVPGFEDILLFYRPSARGIDVLRILHGARDLPAIFEEE
jgi:toxin ParE1/3/4